MGDSEPAPIRPPETITITVLRARNLVRNCLFHYEAEYEYT